MSEIKTINSKVIFDSVSNFDEVIKTIGKSWSKVFVLVDDNTLENCYPLLTSNSDFFANAEIIQVESGEDSKSIEICFQLWSLLQEYGADRNAVLVNLGGGVISDLGGFIASTFKRGIDFINIPTSLLAQVDASVGGKNGVNLHHSKNQVGTFNEPIFTFVDVDFLQSLPSEEMLSGKAEMIKHALIKGKDAYNMMKLHFDDIEFNREFIRDSVSVKNEIVLVDPNEKGERKKLNLGHTIGHALEAYFYQEGKPVTHGVAVAWGILLESEISLEKGMLSTENFQDLYAFISSKYGKIPFVDVDVVLKYVGMDKKNNGAAINLSILKNIGVVVVDFGCEMEDIRNILEKNNN